MAGTVLVTGGAQGLGEALVRAFHAAGYRVAISDINLAGARDLAETLDPTGARAFLALDVTRPESFEAARDAVLARWGSVEVLVNNAVVTVVRPVLDIPPEEFARGRSQPARHFLRMPGLRALL
jgi:3-oxoacyl-[acyl-carrier protein] reductase